MSGRGCATESLWSIDKSGRFISRSFADERVVYDVMSGDTHFLEPLASEVVSHLEHAPQSRDQLVAKLSDAFIFSDEEDLAALTEETLAKLRGIGLVVNFR